jgi:heme-binding uptake protein ChaN (Tiki superfamily)
MQNVVALLLAAAAPLVANPMQEFLRQRGMTPADYVLSKLDDHRIVIVGENHWQRSDALLVASIVPELRRREVALAMEVFLASSQSEIDALISSSEWDPQLANRILHAADWPYVQYRDILHRAWEVNRATAGVPLRLLALGPPGDWREQGIRYDAFMAERVQGYATDGKRPVLVYCGMHHAFTHYLQVERTRDGRATEFMDRMGNLLYRKFGQDVFLVALHKPDGCGEQGNAFAKLCAPLGGEIDCAAVRNGGAPVGFDILGSPIAETKLEAVSFYAVAHPLLRMVDFADGYVWQAPVDDARMVDLIPLQEYEPEKAEDAERRAEWEKRAADLAEPRKRASWASLPAWRSRCGLDPSTPAVSR